MLDVVHKFKSIELIFRALRDVGMFCAIEEVVRLSICKWDRIIRIDDWLS